MVQSIVVTLFLLLTIAFRCNGFTVPQKNSRLTKTSIFMVEVPPPAQPTFEVPPSSHFQTADISRLTVNDHITKWNTNFEKNTEITDSGSTLVSLKDRVIPTKEEVAAKKRNFAFWFWGGGFVAPFLATFYYFGLQFWKR
uniref:Uncharacterized protein n=1 Tax=Proboscia inermis TaxID=420281 RepID=A0A7S0GP19_9STRA|mmetsp:Transcript_9197/g.9304  ORF Transcript_9197/g.9304 Transcript_9197/m.9304 type:complete len:140 (+) Transcript_9197:83-502(+)